LDGNGLPPPPDVSLNPIVVLVPGADDGSSNTPLTLTPLNDGSNTTATPEPGTWLFVGTGLTFLFILRMQGKKSDVLSPQ
jgi:hypothetical protein